MAPKNKNKTTNAAVDPAFAVNKKPKAKKEGKKPKAEKAEKTGTRGRANALTGTTITVADATKVRDGSDRAKIVAAFKKPLAYAVGVQKATDAVGTSAKGLTGDALRRRVAVKIADLVKVGALKIA